MLTQQDIINRQTAYNKFINKLITLNNIKIAHIISYRTGKVKNKTAEDLAKINLNLIINQNIIKFILSNTDKYINYNGNTHHWTTEYCWKAVIPEILKIFNDISFNISDFKKIEFKWNNNNFSYHQFIKNNEFEITDYAIKKTYIGNNDILRNINDCPNMPYSYSLYHMLFKLAHTSGIIKNKSIISNIKLAVNCDSMAIPIIPILAYLFKEILVIDNRTKINHNYADIILKFKPTHYLSIFTEENFLFQIKQWANLK